MSSEERRVAEDDDHRLVVIESIRMYEGGPHRQVAVCGCGWASDPTYTAGLAGGAFDAHRAAALLENDDFS